MQFRARHSFILLVATLLLGYFLFSSGPDARIHTLSGYTMGTSYNLQIVDLPGNIEKAAIGSATAALLNRLDTDIFSTYVADSELSLFNSSAVGQPVSASPELLEVLQIAQQVSVLSSGAFDITVGPLVNLWGFGPGLPGAPGSIGAVAVPDQAALDELRSRIGYQYLQIDARNSQIVKTRPIMLDLSAVAKGYAVDRLASYLDNAGIESYFLEIGGELKIKGFKPGRQSWVPAIEKPLPGQLQIQQILFSNGQELALAGSGDYRNYFEENGVRYSHEIDPRSGRPVSHNLAAVYVIHEQVAWADALATAFMIMGLQQGAELAEDLQLAAYFISRVGADLEVFYTEQFATFIQQQERP